MTFSVRSFTGAALCGAALLAPALAAQGINTRGWFRRTVDRDQGLPETQVNTIAQAGDGYLWLGTRRGIVRYDGSNFTTVSPEQEPALPSNWIRGLTVDQKDRLWIATDQGLAVRERGRMRRVDSTQVPAGVTWDVSVMGEEVWVATASGLYRGDGIRFARVPGADAYLYTLHRDTTGRLWIGGRDFLGYWDGAAIRRVHPAGEPADQDYLDLTGDGDAGVWAATRHGITRVALDRRGGLRVGPRVPATLHGTPSAVWTVQRSADGIVWLGTEVHGVLMWNGAQLSQPAPVSTAQVWAFHEDARGRIWVGTGVGLERFQRSAFQTVASGLGNTHSMWSVRADAQGTIWSAAGNGEVYALVNGQHRQVLRPTSRQVSSAIWPAPAGGMLATRDGHRILHVTPQRVTDRTSTYQLNAGDILGIFTDSKGATWFSTDSGVFRSTGGRAHPMSAHLGLPGGRGPRDIREDAQGRMLFARPGLTRVDATGSRTFGVADGLTDLEVMTIYPRGENVWIGTADSGLFLLRHDRITAFGHTDPRLHQEILGIVEDTLQHLWLTSSFGLSRVGTDELVALVDGRPGPVQVRSFDRQDGLPTTEFNGDYVGALHRDAQGHLWLPSYLGVVAVDPGSVHADSVAPQVHLESVHVDGRPFAVDTPLDLPPGVSRLEVTFAVTDALVPSRVHVQYRMEGISDEWVEAGPRRTLAFGPLAGGTYRLVVRASNEDGSWAREPAILQVRVAYALYEQPWFVPVLVAASAVAVFLVARLRQRRLVRRGRELTAEVAARTADLEAARATLERRVDERTAQLAGELAERKRLETQLLEAQKLESIGRLAGGVAHEINNSMTGVLGFTDLATQGAQDDPALLSDLREIRRAGERVAGITRQLLTFARRQVSLRAAVDPARLVLGQQRALQAMLGEQVHLEIQVAAVLPPVRVDVAQFEQVLINLVLNARDAMPTGGTITLEVNAEWLAAPRTVGSVVLPAGSYVHLTVADAGVGMSADVMARLFEPFFTTKDVHKGTGLGLAVCHGIITQHGGAISAESLPGSGSTMHVWLPATDEAIPIEPEHVEVPSATGHETILVVEDEPAVREVARRTLARQGYTVLEAGNGAEALKLLHTHQAQVDLVLSDVVMPDVDGLSLAQTIRSSGGTTPIVFMSGYAGHGTEVEAQLARIGPTLLKPFSHEGLTTTVRRVLDRSTRTRSVPGRYQPL